MSAFGIQGSFRVFGKCLPPGATHVRLCSNLFKRGVYVRLRRCPEIRVLRLLKIEHEE
jgi:hypothetical protein